ncbi:succinate dehydrogenase, hydrophobic membrane anchor protein [Parasphingopyxis algicola]|uniref:succinate dehydrogenase, hydrophobic membrane anchor protein n=1 Tax=Parasphingopyxis algicola TaxID=2026624 RepID=UPI0015A03E23|nr:succinate dehydrogenase, hydrophobic membrane anchor protein [Parasphingopyxis algicola]QLC25133.1 succinate dehydrogenase, hydrophobic membrane anchor protein [Parasphingopyxis algicola]
MGSGTGLGRVRGLGSAKQGAHHWWMQRLTAAGNVLLVSWFFISLVRLPDLSHAVVTDWLSAPLVAVATILLAANMFWHLRLGLQVTVEDYVHNEASKLGLIVLINFFAVGAGAIAIFSIAKIAFGGAA